VSALLDDTKIKIIIKNIFSFNHHVRLVRMHGFLLRVYWELISTKLILQLRRINCFSFNVNFLLFNWLWDSTWIFLPFNWLWKPNTY